MPAKARAFFTADTFLKFRRDRYGRIDNQAFFQYVLRKVTLAQTRIQLSLYDSTGDGFLREQDLENYIYELIPQLPALSELEENFYPFYVFTATRKFFFFLDPKRRGKIAIKDMLCSGLNILDELHELKAEDWEEDEGGGGGGANWFSSRNALRVYSDYLELDEDHNGMLSKSELISYGNGTLTHVFVNRVFQECHTYEGEMDYKTFLDFVLAMENKPDAPALQYFWRLLDFNKCGYLDIFAINYFFREASQLHCAFMHVGSHTPSPRIAAVQLYAHSPAERRGSLATSDVQPKRKPLSVTEKSDEKVMSSSPPLLLLTYGSAPSCFSPEATTSGAACTLMPSKTLSMSKRSSTSKRRKVSEMRAARSLGRMSQHSFSLLA